MAFRQSELEARKDYRKRIKLEAELGNEIYLHDVADHLGDRGTMSIHAKNIRDLKKQIELLGDGRLSKKYGLTTDRIKALGTYRAHVDGEY